MPEVVAPDAQSINHSDANIGDIGVDEPQPQQPQAEPRAQINIEMVAGRNSIRIQGAENADAANEDYYQEENDDVSESPPS